MNTQTLLPLVLDPALLEKNLGHDDIRIVDLGKPDIYQQAHIPGAVFLDYGRIVRTEKPVMGLLPDEITFETILSALGINKDTHVIAYDDEGGGKASRFLWTLDTIGHEKFSLLDGGLHAWANEGRILDNKTVNIKASDYSVSYKNQSATTNKDYITSNLSNDDTIMVDCRSPQEFNGQRVMASKGGHIPGAINMDWSLSMDQNRNYRLKTQEELESLLDNLGIEKSKEAIVYCQSHHRSALSYIMLKSLGYRVKGYPGSWSEWGNLADTPTEV